MTFLRNHARLAALVLGGLLIAGCDSRLPTRPGTDTGGGDPGDLTPPRITFVLSAGTNNTVDLGAPLSVAVTATDNVGVQTLNTTLNNGASVIGADTSGTLKPTQATTTRTINVPMTGRKDGDRIVIRSTASDASLNFNTDSIVVMISDTTMPKMTLVSTRLNKPGLQIRGGDSVDVTVTASDASGIRYVGYRVIRINSATDTTVVASDSALAPAGSYPATLSPAAFKYKLLDTLQVGSYALAGFAMDGSGRLLYPGPSISYQVVDGVKPQVTILAPLNGDKVNAGDSLYVQVKLHDNIALSRVTLGAGTPRGSVANADFRIDVRYDSIRVPEAGPFPTGTRDVTLYRYLKVKTPIDTTLDSLVVWAKVLDQQQNWDSTATVVYLVSGPKVTFIAPTTGSQATPNAGLTVTIKATHPLGVSKLGFRIQGESTWPTPLDKRDSALYNPALKTVTFTSTVSVPADAPQNGIITITPISVSLDGQPGSSTPMLVTVSTATPPAPLVQQTVGARLEASDSITVNASGNALTYIGFELTDPANPTVPLKRDSIALSAPLPSAALINVPLNLGASAQGKRLAVVSFARDQSGRIGYSLPAGATVSQPVRAAAYVDSTLIVYGRTFPLPVNRDTLIGDIVVDRARGNVFLSNLGYSRLEVWQQTSKQFDPNGIFLGSQPWGMTMSRTALANDTLYVANSGGTNLSRVYIGAATPSGMKEDLAHRILTRISLLYKITEVRDAATGRIRITVTGPILFSDRPQYVQESAGGRLYLSTKPTPASTKGTIRYLDPSAPAPDQRFLLAFATPGSDPNSYLVSNIDAASVTPAPASSNSSDVLTLCDHPSGSTAGQTCASSAGGILSTVDSLRFYVPGTDVEAAPNLDEASLGLTDTTYAAASGDGKWIAFGEGNNAPYSRAFILQDDGSVPDHYSYASPSLNVQDLVNNAADQIFGLALDKSGQTLGLHGVESYFAAVTKPFTQRLQGKYATFGQGAGIAFHPNADGISTPMSDRLSFVASNNGTIEVVDIAYYTGRGRLATKTNLYGPLRASLPFPGDDPSVILKLFGLSTKGLVVIDVTAADIQAGP
jgi:hypothetical protein